MKPSTLPTLATLAALLAGCAGSSASSPNPGAGALPPLASESPGSVQPGPIQHVVIIFQENRTVDNLFHGLPGADTARSGKTAKGKSVKLAPISMTAPFDVSHTHTTWKIEYAHGRLNGFYKAPSTCSSPLPTSCPGADVRAYSYVPRSEVAPYFSMAETYTFADRMFQTNQGPSFPAHQYIISGTSSKRNGSPLLAAENPSTDAGGCDAPPGTYVDLIGPSGKEGYPTYPCFNRTSLMDLINARSLTWRYYEAQLGPGLWNAPDAVLPTYRSPEFSQDVIAPPATVLTDIAAGTLANVTWVTPTAPASDHAGITDGSGPSWVASVVNAIGESQFWNSTAIFVTWDDWGGWYDHVAPTKYNTYELGFRVPLIVISPYAKAGYVSHVQHEFGSILKFTEEAFGLGSLGATDVRADDLSDCFDFSSPPRPFTAIPAALGARYFLKQPTSSRIPDDDR